MRNKRIGYNLNVMRQSACLVINPITVDCYAALFNCTPVDRASDSMMAPTLSYSFCKKYYSNSIPTGSLLDSASESDSKSYELKMSIITLC